MNNNNNDYNSNMDKKQIVVMKRKATILRKREMKETKRVIYQSKKVLKAGLIYSEEKDKVNDKFKIKDAITGQRERKNIIENLILFQVLLTICFIPEPSMMSIK